MPPTKQIEGLRWSPRWVSHLGCVKGCLDYLGADISWAWLYGGTAHAFIINIHEVVCPSGPTAWHYGPLLLDLAPNIGYKIEGVYAHRAKDADFAARQERAWDYVRGCIDEGIPCYGWELAIPEFYVIYGYDEVGYYYSGALCDDGPGPKPWQEVGASEIGAVEMCSVERWEPAPAEKVVKDALAAALKHAKSPPEWIYPKYRSGLQAFDLWADALKNGTAVHFGHAFNAAVWAECRAEAEAFLIEAKERLASRADVLFDEAIGYYSAVHSILKNVAELHPFPPPDGSGQDEELTSPESAALVWEAGAVEQQALEVLEQLVKCL